MTAQIPCGCRVIAVLRFLPQTSRSVSVRKALSALHHTLWQIHIVWLFHSHFRHTHLQIGVKFSETFCFASETKSDADLIEIALN